MAYGRLCRLLYAQNKQLTSKIPKGIIFADGAFLFDLCVGVIVAVVGNKHFVYMVVLSLGGCNVLFAFVKYCFPLDNIGIRRVLLA